MRPARSARACRVCALLLEAARQIVATCIKDDGPQALNLSWLVRCSPDAIERHGFILDIPIALPCGAHQREFDAVHLDAMRTPRNRRRQYRSGEECEETLYHRVRGFLGEVMPALHGATRHFGATVLPPNRQRVVPLTDLALAAPQHQEWTCNLAAGGAAGAIVLQVDARRRPIVLAHALDHFGPAC